MTTVTTSGWHVATGSVRGAAHDRTGLPNQDAVAIAELPEGTVAAVADGHGGPRYVRSDRGARLAVDAAVNIASRWITDPSPRLSVDGARTTLVPAIVERWRHDVRADLAAEPFTAEERERAGAPLDPDPVVAYGATLLLVLATPAGVLVAGLGDGDVIVVAPDGTVSTPLPTDDRLVAGQTTSLCLPDSERDVRYALVEVDRAQLVVVATDGYGNSFAGPDWRTEVASDLRAQVDDRGFDHVAGELPGWLADSAEAGGDDVTVALLSRRAAVPAGGPRPGTAPRATTAPAAPEAREGTARRSGSGVGPLLALVGIAALVVGATLGWAAWGRDTDVAAPAVTSTTTTAAVTTTTVAPPTVPEVLVTMTPIGGGTVSFVADASAPDARWTEEPSPEAATTRIRAGDRIWEVTDRAGVTVRDTRSGRTTNVNLPHAAGSLLWHDGVLWVLDPEGRSLTAIEPGAATVIGTATVTRTAQPQPPGTGSGGGGGGPAGTG